MYAKLCSFQSGVFDITADTEQPEAKEMKSNFAALTKNTGSYVIISTATRSEGSTEIAQPGSRS